MLIVRLKFRYLVLSFVTVLLPVVLLGVAGIVDYVNDRASFFVVLVRYGIVPSFFVAIFFLVIASFRKQDFTSLESSLPRDAKWTIGALGASLILVLLMFWPLSNWAAYLFGGNGDGYNWRWQIWRMSQELRQWHIFPTKFNDVIVPYGADLRLNDGYLAMYVGGIWNLFCNPTLAYNLTLATSVIANFFAARRLSLTLCSSQATSIIAGLVLASAPSLTLRQMGHLNLCFTFVLCLAAIEGIKLVKIERVRVWQPASILILAFLSSFYFFILSAIFYFFCVLIRLAIVRSQRYSCKEFLGRMIFVALIIGVAISPFVVTRLQHDSIERDAGAPTASARTDEYMYYSADPRTFLIPAADAIVSLPRVAEARSDTSPNTVENTPFPGYAAIFAVAALVLLVRKWRWFMVFLWSLFTSLALGPTLIWGADNQFSFFFPHALVESAKSQVIAWLPYGTLTAVPGMSALRTPNRFAMMLPVIGVIAIALLVDEISKRKKKPFLKSALIAAVIVLIIPNFRGNNYWYSTRFPQPISSALQVIHSDDSNLAVLIAGENCLLTISFTNMQIVHRHPMVGCQTFSAAVPWYSGLESYRRSASLAALQCDPNTFGLVPMYPQSKAIAENEVLSNLRETLHVGYVVLPKNQLCHDPARAAVITELLRSSSKVLADTDEYLIVAI